MSAASPSAAARPIVVQSMTNTDTADIDAHRRAGRGAGARRLRDSCASPSTATRRPRPCRTSASGLLALGVDVPLIGDFHYIGHKLLADHPACAEALDKYRINPGNVGFKDKKDRQFAAIIEIAIAHDKPVRIGVNWGSLDQELLTRLMDENAQRAEPARRARGDARGDRAVGAAVGRARRGDRPWPRTASSCRPRSPPCRI